MTAPHPMLAPALGRARRLAGAGGLSSASREHPACGRESAGATAKLSSAAAAKFGGKAPPNPGVDFSRGLAGAWRRRHGVKAAASVAARLGAPVSTVEKWLAGGAPSAPWLGPILAAYGPAFLDEALGGRVPWLTRAARREALERELGAQQPGVAAAFEFSLARPTSSPRSSAVTPSGHPRPTSAVTDAAEARTGQKRGARPARSLARAHPFERAGEAL